jgi:hypothetical protein
MLVRLARAYAGELKVLAIGPLTNIAEALRLGAFFAVARGVDHGDGRGGPGPREHHSGG